MAQRTLRQALAEQAASDFAAYELLQGSDLPECQALHALQMATEKLAKALALLDSEHGLGRTHIAFSKATGVLKRQAFLAHAFGWQPAEFRKFVSRCHRLMRQIEELHPQVPTGGMPDGPNAEYPWLVHSPAGERHWQAPASYNFPVSVNLRTMHDGANLLRLIKLLLRSSDRVFA